MQNRKRIVTIITMLLCSIVCALAGAFVVKADAQAVNFSFNGEIQAEYKVGDVVNIPSASVGDITADVKISLPDGTYTNKESISLKTPGFYLIEYSAILDGKLYKTQKSFVVSGDLFTLKGVGSCEYKTLSSTDVSGMYFNLYSGDSIVYNDIVDLSTLNGPTDTIYRMFPMVSNVGEADITQYEVTLTDAYNENISITVRFKQSLQSSSNDFKVSYVDAKFNDNKYCGLEVNSSGQYTVDNIVGIYSGAEPITSQNYHAHIDNPKFGAPIIASFTGGTQEESRNEGRHWAGIAYDINTNIVYATSNSYRVVIADFENADIFGEKFTGFTDGKVKVTIKPTNYNKGSCGIFISEFAGKKFSEEDTKSFSSTYSPEININYGEYSLDTVPNVRKGDSYQVFDATAYDLVDGLLSTKISVYYGYYGANKIQVDLVDGRFTAKHLGTYTIAYEATNSMGKTSLELLNVISVADNEELDLILTGEPDYNMSLAAGKALKVLDNYNIINAYGHGILSVEAVLKADKTVAFALNESNNYTFTPTTSGEYQIIYTVSDYSSKKIITRNLNVVASNNIYYVTKGAFPEYLIKNGSYNLDVLNAYTLDTGKPVQQEVSLFVEPSYGESLVSVEPILKITEQYITANQTVKLLYRPAQGNIEEDAYFIKEIPVIDTGLYTENFDKSKYFIQGKGKVVFTPQEEFTECEVEKFDEGVANFDFANYISVNSFKLNLKALVRGESFQAFDKLNVYLYDTIDDRNYIVISLFKDTEGWFITVNSQNPLKLSNTWGGADDEFYINFSAAKQRVTINKFFVFNNITFFETDKPVEYLFGAKMRIEILGTDGCDGITIQSINGEILDKHADLAPASIDYSMDNNAGEKTVGETVTLLPFAAYDVFAPYLDVTLQVTLRKLGSNTKEYVKAIDGTELRRCSANRGWEFVLSEFGTYTVQIFAKDGINSDNDTSYSYSILVADNEKPEVQITQKKTSYSKGSTFNNPKFTVNEENYGWYITIETPDGFKTFVNDEKKYNFDKSGKYKVTLIVYDSTMNMSRVSYVVNVK